MIAANEFFRRGVGRALCGLAVPMMAGLPATLDAQGLVITPAAGFMVSWDGNDGDFFDPAPPPGGAIVPDNLALASNGGTAIASAESQFFPTHLIAGLNDGFYGNSNHSHIIGNTGTEPGFMGIALPAAADLTAIAWGRDNGNGNFDDNPAGTDACGGQCDDRWLGTYTLQVTTVADPDETTEDIDWTTIATFEYQSSEDIAPGGGFTPWLRHQYTVSTEGGAPIPATGVRIIVPDLSICIDEIELYAGEVPIPQLRPAESGGGIDIDNLAASGTAFAKDTLGGRQVASLNDQTFGDASAWSGATPDSFAGIGLGDLPVTVSSIAFGRDNTGAQTDRALGEYVLQYTQVANPDETTPDGDWNSIGTILYEAGNPQDPHLRHRFNLGTIMATGLRLLTPDGAAIDEFEVYAERFIPPPPPGLTIAPEPGFSLTWDGNDGDHFDANAPPSGALVPDNLALAVNGATAFASNDPSPHAPTHAVPKLNDGFYGNSNSHINGGGPAPAFMGIALAEPTALSVIAWGRDNGNGNYDDNPAGTDACGGQCDDRSIGNYTLQVTTVPSPDASTPDGDWTTIAVLTYTGGPGTDNEPGGLFTEWLRHQYAIATEGGGPIMATGVRILVSDVGIALDEIELYGVVGPLEGPALDISHDAASGELTIRWESSDGRLYNLRSETDPSAADPIDWPIFGGNMDLAATPPENVVTFPLPADATRLFVVEEFPAPPVAVFEDDFESGQGEWTTGSEGLAGTMWELGTPSNVGPPAAHSPANCFGTNLDADYGVDANVWLRSPAIDLTTAASATLCYYQFRDIETPGPPVFDSGTVSVLDAADDSVLAVIQADITGFSADWEKVTRAVPAAALGRMVKFEFRLQSDDLQQFAGWYIDDVTVTVP